MLTRFAPTHVDSALLLQSAAFQVPLSAESILGMPHPQDSPCGIACRDSILLAPNKQDSWLRTQS